eukprot:symbB.v1.2.028756.t1/scaffold3010.1/size65452/1
MTQDKDKKDKKDSISDLDFRKLMSLAEQRRGHKADVHASNASNASPSRQSPSAKRVKKVLLMPSPDEHYLSIERERRAEKMAAMSIASPTSPCSEADAMYLDPKRYFRSKARGDPSSQRLLWSLTRTAKPQDKTPRFHEFLIFVSQTE